MPSNTTLPPIVRPFWRSQGHMRETNKHALKNGKWTDEEIGSQILYSRQQTYYNV